MCDHADIKSTIAFVHFNGVLTAKSYCFQCRTPVVLVDGQWQTIESEGDWNCPSNTAVNPPCR